MFKAIDEASMAEQKTPCSGPDDYILPVTFPAFYQHYFAALVDLAVIFVSAYFVAAYTPLFESVSFEQLIVILMLSFVYDAFFTAKRCTLGQLLLNFRVRNRSRLNRIVISTALLRGVIKILFGGYSLIAMIFNREQPCCA